MRVLWKRLEARRAPDDPGTPSSPVLPSAGWLVAALLVLALPRLTRGESEIVERFSGTARVPGGAVLYLEDHVVRRAADRLLRAETLYRDPQRKLIAVLRTDFSADPFAPSYQFRDLRTGAAEAVEVSKNGLTLRSSKRSRTLPLSEDGRLAAGQGLDRLVRERLEALAGGEEIAVAYAIPSRLDTFQFRVRASEERAGGATLAVRVELQSWILRLLAPKLEVEYDRATRRLVRYRGVSNLEDASGKHPQVEITYAYPDEPGARAGEIHASP